MNPGTDGLLDAVAAALVDESPVDWAGEMERAPELAATIRRLRTIEAVASAHRDSRAAWASRAGAGPASESGAAVAAPLFTWGPLRILERLGSGTSGEVFRAYEPTLSREVALKLRRAAGADTAIAVPRFLDEGRRLARVRHPNVVTVHGADVHGGRAGIWTDLVEGRTLESGLAENGPLGAPEAVAIGLDLCRALAAVHAAGLVHGDVKTTNVMRERGGRIVLMDFGSGHELATEASRPALFVTPLASAPEVLRGDPPGPASDLYSLGVLLFRLASGRYPVEASDLSDLLARHERGERLGLRDLRPDLPSPFVETVERAIAAEPHARFASTGAMEASLARGTSVATPAPAAVTRPGFRWRIAALAALLAAIAALVVIRREDQRSSLTTSSPVTGRIEPAPTGAEETSSPARDAVDATPAGPLASTSLRVEAGMFRMAASGPQALANGARVAPGDALFMNLRPAEPVHVYVLNEDLAGSVYLLFPVAGLEPSNPLAAGETHRLPGRRSMEALDWEVTTAGGRETFLIVAAREPIPSLDRLLAGVEPVRVGRAVAYPQLSSEEIGVLRGVGGMKPSRAPASGTAGRIAEIERSLAGRPGDFWVRHIELDNPAR